MLLQCKMVSGCRLWKRDQFCHVVREWSAFCVAAEVLLSFPLTPVSPSSGILWLLYALQTKIDIVDPLVHCSPVLSELMGLLLLGKA